MYPEQLKETQLNLKNLKLADKVFLNAKWNLWSSIALTPTKKLLNKLHENIFYVLIASQSMKGFAVVQ